MFNIEKSNIVIINNETKFLRPVTKDIVCQTFVPDDTNISQLKDKLQNKKSGSIKITSQIMEDNNICVLFKGTYVIKIL